MSSPPTGSTLGFADAMNFVRNILNASSMTYSGTNANDDPKRWPEGVIIDAIRGADALIYNTVAQAPGHPKRAELLTPSTNIVHTGMIPDHEGPIGAILIGGKSGRWLTASEIGKLRELVITFFDQGPYWDLIDNRLYYYPGSTATVDIVPPYNSSGSTLQSPQAYFHGITSMALAMLFGKEGAETQTAAYYKSVYDTVYQMIKDGAQMIQPVVAYQKGSMDGN